MVDHSGMMLGRLQAVFDARVPLLSDYRENLRFGALPKPSLAATWIPSEITWTMAKNDTLGDCTIAAKSHIIAQWTSYTQGTPLVWTDDQVVSDYMRLTGGQDTGLAELTVLTDWLTKGSYGDKLTAFAQINLRNQDEIRDAVTWFGNVYVGADMPLSAQSQDVWDVPWYGAWGQAAPGSWGGHAFPIMEYDPMGLTCITWGQEKRMTWRWLKKYVVEAYALISEDWISATGTTPGGLDLAALKADMAVLRTA